MKAKILELVKPLNDFMREEGIASFGLDNGSETCRGDLDISAYRTPLPPTIKCTLKRHGCIYMIDKELLNGTGN